MCKPMLSAEAKKSVNTFVVSVGDGTRLIRFTLCKQIFNDEHKTIKYIATKNFSSSNMIDTFLDKKLKLNNKIFYTTPSQ